jgi:hypothetical protein
MLQRPKRGEDVEKHFIVGNGPSLQITDLDLLNGHISWGLNRIHLIYPRTTWRPTYYVKTDHNPHLKDVYNEENLFHVEQGYHCYFWEKFKTGYPPEHAANEWMPEGIGDDHKNVTWLERCEHHYYHHDNIHKKAQSWHLPEICTAFSGISPAIQLAVLNGADEIYLVGCDLGYGNDVGHDHFSEEYSKYPKKLSDWHTNEVLEAHKMAYRSSPVKIFNATVGGSLEVYKRVRLENVV